MAGESAREEARRARQKAERLARRAEMFEKGAEGEAATAAVLSTLPSGWTATHDVRWPSRRLANIDHILVGPGGIFVIDSKNWSGRITLEDGHLRQDGRSREKAVAGCADAGLAVAELAGPHADKVFPVLCFLTDEPLAGWCRDVMVCSAATLTQMLVTRPTVLDHEASTDAWLRLDAQFRAATSTPADNRMQAAARGGWISTPKAQPRPSARSRRAAARSQKALRQFVVSTVLLVSFVAYGPQVSSAVGGLLTEQFTKNPTPPTACGDTGARHSRHAAGQGQPGRKKRTRTAQNHAAGRSAEARTGTTGTSTSTPDC